MNPDTAKRKLDSSRTWLPVPYESASQLPFGVEEGTGAIVSGRAYIYRSDAWISQKRLSDVDDGVQGEWPGINLGVLACTIIQLVDRNGRVIRSKSDD